MELKPLITGATEILTLLMKFSHQRKQECMKLYRFPLTFCKWVEWAVIILIIIVASSFLAKALLLVLSVLMRCLLMGCFMVPYTSRENITLHLVLLQIPGVFKHTTQSPPFPQGFCSKHLSWFADTQSEIIDLGNQLFHRRRIFHERRTKMWVKSIFSVVLTTFSLD